MPYVQTVSERLVYSFNIFITNSIYQPAYIEPTRHGVMRPLMPEQVSHDVRWVFTPLLPPHSCELMVHQYRPIAGVQPSRVNARTDKKRVVSSTAFCKKGASFQRGHWRRPFPAYTRKVFTHWYCLFCLFYSEFR